MLAGCLTAAAVVGVSIALLFQHGDRADTVRTALAVEDDGRSICRAVINEADPAWLFVSLDEPGEAAADYIVELELEHGDLVRVGRIEVRDGHGALATTLDLNGVRARAVRLVDSGGGARLRGDLRLTRRVSGAPRNPSRRCARIPG